MTTYTCPMHPEIKEAKPGKCPKCGMKLKTQAEINKTNHDSAEQNSYFPLFVIVGLITLVTASLAVQSYFTGTFAIKSVLMNFMAGFFLVFSGFKLLDVKGFAEGYATYDLLAQRFFPYGYVYPFIELVLGLMFLLHINSPLLPLIAFILMTFSGIGVAIKIAKKEQFQCACLGTFLKVPLTKVTLVEDFGMAILALVMFLLY